MNEGFVPLATRMSTNNSAEPFRVKVVASANGAAIPFQSLDTQRGSTATQLAHGQPAGQSQVSLVRDGDRITGVRVQCGCGEVIELQCVY
jgi:hypothetical protein